MLPMSKDTLEGIASIDHESRLNPGRFCTFSGNRDFGNTLVAAMQAQILMGYKPYHDEGQDRWQPMPGADSM